MDSLLWQLRTNAGFTISSQLFFSLLILALLCWDYILLLPRSFWRGARGRGGHAPALPTPCPSALVVIPSLLRKREELTSMFSTIESVATNGYPGDLVIVVSIDGCEDAPHLYGELTSWARRQRWNDHHWLHVVGTPRRRGKPLAIDHAVEHVKELVAAGVHPRFPEAYISTDADADLGPHALERIVARLFTRHPWTGWPARAVAGNLYIRGNAFWGGWRRFFTVRGQLTIQVAREYLVTNVARHNIRWMPLSGVPGVLYCTWSEILLQAPRYLGYLRTLRRRDWLRWWIGVAPPKFSETEAAPIPELMAGDTDDTVSAYMAIIARWKDGRFTFDAPRTPLHALLYMLRGVFVDRALRYEPEARVYTSSPETIRALFKQRKRWNASRIEVTGRFWRALGYHWPLGFSAMAVMFLIARYCVFGGLMYLVLPMVVMRTTILGAFVLGYSFQLAGYSMLTFFALVLNGELRHWKLVLALPLSPIYAFVFTYSPTVAGAVSDVLLFGNRTGFAPETTLVRGGSTRLALLFRLRRALLLAVRAVVRGDVPFGSFWFGWGETAWTPSGFEGWTSGARPRPILPPASSWFGHRGAGAAAPSPLHSLEQ